ncbi:hypothetical protein RSAG8_06811, partial [Rhizoctonia solani AG-8 WAC10335]
MREAEELVVSILHDSLEPLTKEQIIAVAINRVLCAGVNLFEIHRFLYWNKR